MEPLKALAVRPDVEEAKAQELAVASEARPLGEDGHGDDLRITEQSRAGSQGQGETRTGFLGRPAHRGPSSSGGVGDWKPTSPRSSWNAELGLNEEDS